MKGDLQELGEDVDENVVSISKMQTQVLNLTHGKVNIFDDSTGAFKSTYEILKEIDAVYPKLKDTEQADLLETIAGKNRANEVAALLGNWKQAENAVDSALNSDGSALKEYGIYADSIEGKVKKLSATFSELANNLVKSGTAKGAISFLTSVLNIVNKLTHSVGTIGTLGIATIITQVVRNLKTLKGVFSDISKNGFSGFWKDSGSKVTGWLKSLSGIASIASAVAVGIGAIYSAYNNYRQERREAWQSGIDKADESKANRDNIQSLYSEYQSARNSYDGTAESKTNLANATTSLLSALGMEESEIDNLISKYGLYSDAINDVANNAVLDNLQKSVNDAQNGWNDAANLFVDDFKGFLGNRSKLSIGSGLYTSLKERSLLDEISNELGLEQEKSVRGAETGRLTIFDGKVETVNDAIEAYNNLKSVIEWFDKEQVNGRFTQSDLSENDIYNNAKSRMSEIEADYEKYIEETENLNKLLAEIEVRKGLENLPEGIDTSTAEGYKSIRSMYASALMNNNLFTGSQEDAENIIDNLVSSGTIQQLADGFNALSEAEAEAASTTDNTADKIARLRDQFAEKDKKNGIDVDLNSSSTSQQNQISQMEDWINAYENLLNEQSKIEDWGLEDFGSAFDTSGESFIQSKFGNIDMDKRTIIEWSESLKNQYKNALDSWDYDPEIGGIDTVFGGSGRFGENVLEEGVEIAFTPILNTDDGKAVFLDKGTVYDYIEGLVDESVDDGKLSIDKLLKLDSIGKNINGVQVKNLIGAADTGLDYDDNGNWAETVGRLMHFSGNFGAIALGFEDVKKCADEAGLSVDDFLEKMENEYSKNDSNGKPNSFLDWFDNLSEEDQDLVYKISVKTDDSSLWTLTKWKEELEAFKKTGMTTEDSWDNFVAIMNNTEEGGFKKTLETYSTALSSLKEGFLGISNGTLDQDEIYNLAMQFPELAPYINDTDALKNKILELMNSTNSSAMSEFDSRIQEVGGSSTEAGKALGLLKDQFNQLNSLSFSDIFNIEDATTQFNNFYSAVKNSVTGTGLTSSDIKNVDSMFSGLSGYDKSALFEKTANGIHLNVQEMRKLQAQQEALTKSNFQSELLSLTDQYEAAAEQLSHMTKGTDEYNSKLSEVNSLSKQIDEVSTLATQYEGLTSSYNKWVQAQSTENEGAMYQSMRNYIETAQKEYDSGKTNTDDFISYVGLLSGKEIYTGKQASEAWEQLHQTIEGTSYTAMDFFEEGSDGALNFLKAVNQIDPALANVDKDGNWTIDFGIGTDEDVAKKLGISVEAVQAILRELTEYDFVMKLDNPYTQINKLKLACDEADNALKAMGQEPVDIDIDTNDVDSEIKKALGLIDEINSSDIDPDVKEAKLEDANAKLDYLIQKKQLVSQPAFMYIDTDKLSGGMSKAVGLLQEYQTAVNNVETLKLKGVDGKDLADAESKVNALAKKIASLPSSVKVALGFEETDDAETIKKKIAEGSVKVDVDADVSDAEEELNNLDGKEVTTQDNLQVNGKEQLDDIAKPVTKTVNIATVQQVGDRNLWTGSLGIAANTMQVESRKVNVDVSVSGQNQVSNLAATIRRVPDKTARVNASVNGTSAVANLSSTVRRVPDQKMSTVSAVVNGYSYVKNLLDDINKLPNSKTVNIVVNQTTNNSNFIGPTKSNGTASADGTAITGHSFAKGNWGIKDSGTALVGELGQELLVRNGHYYTIGDDSAEFVHYQKGDIIFNAEQTKELLSKGKITASRRRGRSFSSGSGNFGGGGSSSSGGGSSSSGGGSSGGGSNSSGSSSSGSSSASTEKEFKETIDWIEIAIDRIERIISRLKLKAESVYSLWTERNKNLVSEIQKVRDEIDLQGKAYDRYIKEANSVGLSEVYAKKVRDGTIDIEKITNEDLYDKIQEYKQWYEKALDCKDAIDQLKETEAELYKTAFDNISTEYDALITELDNRKSLIEEYINQFENKGYITTSKFYEKLIQEEQENISKLIEERNKLQVALDTAVNSGTIKEGSEAWYEMKNSIDEVTVSIEESKTSILDYANSIREVKWDTFDMILDRMSKITDEADNLIDLFSENDLFEEIGSLTEQGLSTMGLHGLNYNVYMEQARKYANEIEEIQKQLAENPYDKELIERKSELLELQREIVLSAKEEKSAIVELVKQGIQKELDHLQKLIDKYNDALDSEKDLYDYQKKIKDQMKTINSIEKQLLAYQNDDSEETRLKIQELKNSLSDEKDNLKDMEYERYISDQKELLSNLYTEYEDILNARLDNIDKLISDMMDLINDNSGSIRDSIDNISEKLGIVISDEMKDIWHNSDIGNSVKYYDYQKWNDEVTKVSNTTEKIYQSIVDMTKDLSDISESILNNSSMLNNSNSVSEQGIIQRSNGDILIPVNQKEIVIESDSVFGKSSVDLFGLYRKESSQQDVPIKNLDGYSTVNNNDLSVQINLPNVKNYDDFKKALQRDKSFESMVRAMTTDRMFGGSSLKKYRS